jgi:hypothetical protein
MMHRWKVRDVTVIVVSKGYLAPDTIIAMRKVV